MSVVCLPKINSLFLCHMIIFASDDFGLTHKRKSKVTKEYSNKYFDRLPKKKKIIKRTIIKQVENAIIFFLNDNGLPNMRD